MSPFKNKGKKVGVKNIQSLIPKNLNPEWLSLKKGRVVLKERKVRTKVSHQFVVSL